MKRPTAADVRAGLWALRSLRRTRSSLRRAPLEAPPLGLPAAVPASGERGMEAVLGRRRATCLERAAVRQVWLAAHGRRCDLVIGVRPPPDFAAHAWLDGDPGTAGDGFVELLRRPSP